MSRNKRSRIVSPQAIASTTKGVFTATRPACSLHGGLAEQTAHWRLTAGLTALISSLIGQPLCLSWVISPGRCCLVAQHLVTVRHTQTHCEVLSHTHTHTLKEKVQLFYAAFLYKHNTLVVTDCCILFLCVLSSFF